MFLSVTRRFAYLLCLWAAFPILLHAQSGIGHSPVSRFGFGMPLEWGISRNAAIGGCGQAVPDADYPNFLNPALLHFNRKVNLNTDLHYSFRNLSQTGQQNLQQGSAGPLLLSIVVPVKGYLSAGAGIRPYSFREFIYREIRYAGNDSIAIRTRGSGGLSQAFLSFGIRLNRYFSVGLEGSYVFGTLEDSATFGVLPLDLNYTFGNVLKRKVSQFLLRPGIHFMMPLSAKSEVFFTAGASAELGSNFSLQRFNQFSIPGTFIRDTLEFEKTSAIRKPVSVKTGFGLFKPSSWSVCAEVDFTSASSIPSDGPINFRDAFGWRLGAEFTPGIKKSTSYLNLISYRLGMARQQLPYTDGGYQYSDFKVTAGASFPIVRKDAKFSKPIINLSFSQGWNGNESSGFGSEKYFQIHLGFTLNDFLWFNRYKID